MCIRFGWCNSTLGAHIVKRKERETSSTSFVPLGNGQLNSTLKQGVEILKPEIYIWNTTSFRQVDHSITTINSEVHLECPSFMHILILVMVIVGSSFRSDDGEWFTLIWCHRCSLFIMQSVNGVFFNCPSWSELLHHIPNCEWDRCHYGHSNRNHYFFFFRKKGGKSK